MENSWNLNQKLIDLAKKGVDLLGIINRENY